MKKIKIKSLTFGCLVACAMSMNVTAAQFKIALGGNEGSGQYALSTKFVQELEARTDDTAKLFLNSQLGSEQNTVNDAAIGALDFSVVAINNITPFSPTVGVLTLPYMIQTLDEAAKITQGEVGEQLINNTIRDAGVRIVAWGYSGFRVLSNSKRPVKTLDDLQGLVIRVPKNEIMIDTYRSWGINPTPMAWASLFTALQQKVVDGQDLSLIDIKTSKFDEVQSYLSDIHYNFLVEPMIMSESVFQEQTPEVQNAIIESGKMATAHSLEFLKREEALAKAELIKRGMEFDEVDESEWIERATTAVWPKYYESVGGVDKINSILRLLNRPEVN
ncbi:TRAP transporter substrate-binding protein [Marinomonas sp. 15G1-11]|uniref:TRAP transporter substrate-binding protein n=1 Tax=Marinomonas phaeophyticola TaxID=3004091 RepID=A0ABT4JV55_9GAMM|nr:TRAP transporter substrate-binding protein [Marinomonas sp. 15G1-11]MCZ2721922.1 TRAP transporter substrate-binding protein [Marinomonas sp. 15G1-11]